MAKTYKGSWRRILDLPPIDWALLAEERSRSKRHTPASIAKIKAARAKHEKAKRRRQRAKAAELYKPIRQAAKGIDALGTMLGAMEPGQWYGRTDIKNLSGLKRGTVAGTIIVAERRGLLERTKNPAWERPGGFECEFLYRKVCLNPEVHDHVEDQGNGAGAPE